MGSNNIFKFFHNVFRFSIFVCVVNLSEHTSSLDICNFPAIVNFGDSNSDTGGYSAVFGIIPSPYGDTYFGMPFGRYSDGLLIIDYLAKDLGLPFISAYLNSMGSNFTQGVNFAVTLATIKPLVLLTPTPIATPSNLDMQYIEFLIFKSKLPSFRNQGGFFGSVIPKEDDISKALYTIDIGHNDIAIGFWILNMTSEQVTAALPDLVNRIAKHVQALYELGARSFWIHNTGPIGCMAYLLEIPSSQGHYDNVGCAKNINTVVRIFNDKLKKSIVGLRNKLTDAAITYVDIYSIKYSLFKAPKKHGFVDPLVVCCGTGSKYNYNASMFCGNGAKSCLDPSVKVNWDGVHFTDAANRVVFEQIMTGAFSDPPHSPCLACRR